MRILNLVTQMEAGGAQTAAIALTQELRNQGYNVETWFLYQKRPTYSALPHVKIVSDSKPQTIYQLMHMLYTLLRMLVAYKPDAIVTHTKYANYLGAICGLLTNIRVRVAVLHGPVWKHSRFHRVVDTFLGTVGVYTSIVAVSNTVYHSIKSRPIRYRGRVNIIHNGVPAPTKQNRDTLPEKYNIPVGENILVSVGRLHPTKNQRFLLELMQLAPDWQLLLIGEGEDRAYLENVVKERGLSGRVHFLGEVPPSDIISILSYSKAFLFPSKSEAFGYAAVEAAIAGVPIIASDIPAMRELFGTNSGAAKLLKLDTPDDWLAAIRSTLTCKKVWRLRTRAAYAAVAPFRVQTMGARYIEVITSHKLITT